MGMFSWNCRYCGRSIRSSQTHYKGWMGYAVVVMKDGRTYRGEYDGYGGVDDWESNDYDHEGFAMYHEDCYTAAGKPVYDLDSNRAVDQGWGWDEPFTIFPPEYNPETYVSPVERDHREKKSENKTTREVHAAEMSNVLKDVLAALGDDLGLTAQASVVDVMRAASFVPDIYMPGGYTMRSAVKAIGQVLGGFGLPTTMTVGEVLDAMRQ